MEIEPWISLQIASLVGREKMEIIFFRATKYRPYLENGKNETSQTDFIHLFGFNIGYVRVYNLVACK